MAFNKDQDPDEMRGQEFPADFLTTGMRQGAKPSRKTPPSMEASMKQPGPKKKAMAMKSPNALMRQGGK